MQLKDAVTQMLKDNGKTKVWLAQKLGYKFPSGLSNRLKCSNITLENLCKICEQLDYEVCIQPTKIRGSRPEKQIVLDARPPKEESKE